jgi:hypothetical protein
MSRINILKISLPILLFVIFFNFSFSQNLSGSNISINIEWQALDSYTPTFYKGRALPGEEAVIKVVPFVEVNSSVGNIDTSKLFYVWTYNDSLVYGDSNNLIGNILYITLDYYRPVNTLKLDVYTDSSQSSLLGKKTIEILPFSSLPILYRKYDNPILTYSNAINKKYEELQVNSNDSFNIVAEPYFFSAKNTLDPVLTYSWTADGVFNGNIGSNIYNYFAGNINKLDLKITRKQKMLLQEGETLINFSVNQ